MPRNARLTAASDYAKARNRLDELRDQKERNTKRGLELDNLIADQEQAVASAEAALKEMAPTAAPT